MLTRASEEWREQGWGESSAGMWFPKRLELIHRENLGAWMAWKNCLKGKQGAFVSAIHWVWVPLNPCRRRCEHGGSTSLQQRAFPGSGGSPEPLGLKLWKNSGLVRSQKRIGWHSTEIHYYFLSKTHIFHLYEHMRHTQALAWELRTWILKPTLEIYFVCLGLDCFLG